MWSRSEQPAFSSGAGLGPLPPSCALPPADSPLYSHLHPTGAGKGKSELVRQLCRNQSQSFLTEELRQVTRQHLRFYRTFPMGTWGAGFPSGFGGLGKHPSQQCLDSPGLRFWAPAEIGQDRNTCGPLPARGHSSYPAMKSGQCWSCGRFLPLAPRSLTPLCGPDFPHWALPRSRPFMSVPGSSRDPSSSPGKWVEPQNPTPGTAVRWEERGCVPG